MVNSGAYLPTSAVEAFRKGPAGLKGTEYRLAELGLLSAEEATQFEHLATLIGQYLRIPEPARPLCLSVFGAPGSGKSRLVRALRTRLKSDENAKLGELVEINLTQVAGVENLAS